MCSSLSYRVNKGSFGVGERAANTSSHIAKNAAFWPLIGWNKLCEYRWWANRGFVLIWLFVLMHLRCNVQSSLWFCVDSGSFTLLGNVLHLRFCWVFVFVFLIISRLWFIPAQTGVYYYNDHFFMIWFFFVSIVCFLKMTPKNPHLEPVVYPCFICPSRSPLHLLALWKPMSCFTIWQEKVCRPSTISPGSHVCTSPVWLQYRSYWPTAQTTPWRRSI